MYVVDYICTAQRKRGGGAAVFLVQMLSPWECLR